MKERKTASEASLSIPPRTPWVRASKPPLTELLASASGVFGGLGVHAEVGDEGLDLGAPSCRRSERLCGLTGDSPQDEQAHPGRDGEDQEEDQSRADRSRECARRRSQSTAGEVTEAMIAAVRTGMTIVWVSERSQIVPISAAATPTRSQAEKPRSRIHFGAAKIPLSSSGSISMLAPLAHPPAAYAPPTTQRLPWSPWRPLTG